MAITQLHQQRLQDQTINSSMARQALINSNFDVWQRGFTGSTPDLIVTYWADHWVDYPVKDGGTLPTLTRSRQVITPGDLLNSWYYSRLTTNGAGTSLGVNSVHLMWQKIEYGNRLLCGLNKKVTVSFWARSSISNKRLAFTLTQVYGTGGSPSPDEQMLNDAITLTSTWTKYTHTFTTNTLVGKTFGTNNNDALQFNIWLAWGTTTGNLIQTGISAETYVGSGTIDIAQVQVCAGDEALPYLPKTRLQEYMDCKRYWLQSYDEGTAAGTITNNAKVTWTSSGGNYDCNYHLFPVQMAVQPIVVFYSPVTGTSARFRNESAVADVAGTTSFPTVNGADFVVNGVATVASSILSTHFTAFAEL